MEVKIFSVNLIIITVDQKTNSDRLNSTLALTPKWFGLKGNIFRWTARTNTEPSLRPGTPAFRRIRRTLLIDTECNTTSSLSVWQVIILNSHQVHYHSI